MPHFAESGSRNSFLFIQLNLIFHHLFSIISQTRKLILHLKKHAFVFFSLLILWLFDPLLSFLLQNQGHRLFYAATLLCGLSLVWGVIYVGEMLRYFLIRKGWLKQTFPGMDWAISGLLGLALFGNVAIVATVFAIKMAFIYKAFFTLYVLTATLFVEPRQLTLPFRRLYRFYRQQSFLRWLWWIPIITFGLRYLVTTLPINGTEQLHNTLPFAKYVFRGIDFNSYGLDTHFLLLGVYETFGVFIRAFLMNDFTYHIVAQQVTFLLTIGSMLLFLGTIPWVLRKLPLLSIGLAAWPTMLNFAPTDTIAFKPDWIGVLAAAVATVALLRQWLSSSRSAQRTSMITVVMFSAFAITFKLTALPYVIFLLPASVVLSVVQQKKIQLIHWMLPLLFLLLCLPFFGKNTLWLGNPVFPGFQQILPKPERLADTTNFNTFQINKNTQKAPEWLDYMGGYLRFWKHHPEFLISILLLLGLLKQNQRSKVALVSLGFLFLYLSLMSFYFYPGIYQRYVAFAYILLLILTVFVFLEFDRHTISKAKKWFIGGFAVLMLTHSRAEVNFQQALPGLWQGISPKEYRIGQDSVDQIYFEINARCTNVGRLFNNKWRNYFYANFDTVNLEDLMGFGALYESEFYEKYNVNFVITPDAGPKYEHLKKASKSWFAENFSVVYRAKGLLLWQRHHFKNCHPPFVNRTGKGAEK